MLALLSGFAAGFAGQRVAEDLHEMALEDRQTDGRGVTPTDRTLAPPRPAMESRGVTTADRTLAPPRPAMESRGFSPGVLTDRSLPSVRPSIDRQIGTRGVTDYVPGNPNPIIPDVKPGTGFPNPFNQPQPTTNGDGGKPTRYYEGNDPFSVLSDLYLRAFGSDESRQGTTQYSVVPQEIGGSSGGSSVFLILLVLVGAGFGIWYFYFRG